MKRSFRRSLLACFAFLTISISPNLFAENLVPSIAAVYQYFPNPGESDPIVFPFVVIRQGYHTTIRVCPGLTDFEAQSDGSMIFDWTKVDIRNLLMNRCWEPQNIDLQRRYVQYSGQNWVSYAILSGSSRADASEFVEITSSTWTINLAGDGISSIAPNDVVEVVSRIRHDKLDIPPVAEGHVESSTINYHLIGVPYGVVKLNYPEIKD